MFDYIAPPQTLLGPNHVYVHSDRERANKKLSVKNIYPKTVPRETSFNQECPTSTPTNVSLLQKHPSSPLPLAPSCSCGLSVHVDIPKGSCPSFMQTSVALIQKVFESGTPNRDGLRILLSDHSLHADAWEEMLDGYFDGDEILQSVKYGWDLGLSDNPQPRDAKFNHPSARQFEADVEAYIHAELQHGAMCGPFKEGDLPFPFAASPLGTVPKANSDIRRTITDCTFRGMGINEWISKKLYRGDPWDLHLPGIDDVIKMVDECREEFPDEEIVLYKLDLSRYYRNWRVNPGDVPFLAIRWKNQIYLDLSYSFGNRAAMYGSQRSSDSLAWMVRTRLPPAPGLRNSGASCRCSTRCSCGSNKVCAYVDDFIGACPKSRAEFIWQSFLNLLDKLGLKPSETKGHLCPPALQITALGILVDLEANTLSIPPDKLQKALTLLQDWVNRAMATKRMLQKLLGVLLHLSRVVRQGRLFVNRMLCTMRRAEDLDVAVVLDQEFKKDIHWWLKHIRVWNGVSLLKFSQFDNKVQLDASTNGWWNGRPGIRGYNFLRHEFFRTSVPDDWPWMRIEDLELVAHILAARCWGWSWNGCQIFGQTDSEPCEFLLRNGRSTVPHRLEMARFFCDLQLKHNFLWHTAGIRSKENILSDCLSRWSCAERRQKFDATLGDLGISSAKRVHVPSTFFKVDVSP